MGDMTVYCDNIECTWEYGGICQRGTINIELVGGEPKCMDEMEWDDDEQNVK